MKLDRNDLRQILMTRDWDKLGSVQARDGRLFRLLGAFYVHEDHLLRWRSIEVTGLLCRMRAEEGDTARSKQIIQQMFWSMNDESGNLIWCAPEVIAEVLANVPKLAERESA